MVRGRLLKYYWLVVQMVNKLVALRMIMEGGAGGNHSVSSPDVFCVMGMVSVIFCIVCL